MRWEGGGGERELAGRYCSPPHPDHKLASPFLSIFSKCSPRAESLDPRRRNAREEGRPKLPKKSKEGLCARENQIVTPENSIRFF